MKFESSVMLLLFIPRQMKLEQSWFLRQSAKTMSPLPANAEEGEKRSAVFCQVTGVHLMCRIFMNDLLKGQE